MIAKASTKYVRISPVKVRRIANEIKNKNVLDAEAYLSVISNKGGIVLKKIIHSARTNYLNKSKDKNIDEKNLIVKNILVNCGPTLKRFQPISKGRAQKILKRSCHIIVEVINKEEGSDGSES